MNGQEIIEKIKELGIDGSYFAYELDGEHEVFGFVEEVNKEGDSEGGGEYSEVVLYFKDHDVYIKVTGVYYSYNGTEWDNNFTQVVPTLKTITVFE